MGRNKYLTIPEELIDIAVMAEAHFRELGYRISIEKRELGFPYVPAFIATRGPTKNIVEISSQIDSDKTLQWIRYCRSCTSDHRLILCCPPSPKITEANIESLRRSRVGFYRAVVADREIIEILAPHDLAINVQPPDKKNLSNNLRRLLGPAYEKFDRGFWREGFEEASLALETEARKYLKREVKNRISIVGKKGKLVKPTQREIDKMTLGQLAGTFKKIDTPNYTDTQLAKILPKINSDRIGVVHKKQKASVEAQLRRNVGKNIWMVIEGLKAISGEQ